MKKLPIGTHWTYEVKLDGFRIEAVRTEDAVRLYSKHGKLLTRQFFQVALELQKLPSEEPQLPLLLSRPAFSWRLWEAAEKPHNRPRKRCG